MPDFEVISREAAVARSYIVESSQVMSEYVEYLQQLGPGQVGRITPSPADSIATIHRRLQAAIWASGKDVEMELVGEVIYFGERRLKMSLEEFAVILPDWYCKFKQSNEYYTSEYQRLLTELPAKVDRCKCLELDDLCAIADWGGNLRGIKERLCEREENTNERIRKQTRQAIDREAKGAIESILELKPWGLSYGSKTLAFMKPSRYAMLDERMRGSFRPRIPNSSGGYADFLQHCGRLQRKVVSPYPEPHGEWRFIDIGQALFQYAKDGGIIVVSTPA